MKSPTLLLVVHTAGVAGGQQHRSPEPGRGSQLGAMHSKKTAKSSLTKAEEEIVGGYKCMVQIRGSYAWEKGVYLYPRCASSVLGDVAGPWLSVHFEKYREGRRARRVQ